MGEDVVKPLFSVVFCYRDKDLLRVQRSLQSLNECYDETFEVIFVDYGSNEQYQNSIRDLLNGFPFVKYVYTVTEGRPWNRAHALNTGVKFCRSGFVFTADIDLIVVNEFVSIIKGRCIPDTATFFSVYLTTRDFSDWNNIHNYTKLIKTGNQGLGISLIPKSFFDTAGGYDEFFSIWGYEDNELFDRFNYKGLKSEYFGDKPIAYHQWHVNAYEVPEIFPEGWRNFNRNVYELDRKNYPAIDFKAQGRRYLPGDRPALIKLQDSDTSFHLLKGTLPYMQLTLQKKLYNASPNESVCCSFEETTYQHYVKSRLTRWINGCNRILKLLNAPFKVKSDYEHLHLSVYQVRDMFLYFVKYNDQVISDFAFELSEQNRKIKFAFTKCLS